MSESAKPPKPNTDAPNEEARMRQALGLREDGTYHRTSPPRREHDGRGRRFVKEGEVPVVVLSGPPREPANGAAPANRVAAAEGALKTERAARERAEHALREALSSVERLETKLAHADIAHAEALAAERQAREMAEQALGEAVAARQALESRSAELEARLSEAETKRARGSRRAAVRESAEREPEPVKWWLPSYRAKSGKKK